MTEIEILFQDQDIAVMVKPPGLVVNRAETVKEPTLQEWWEARLKESGSEQGSEGWRKLVPAEFAAEFGTPEEIFAQRGGVVHRLDKETSGVMVLAKNPGALVHLLQQFRQRKVQKMYTCLVHGKFQVMEDVVSLPLARSTQNRTKFAVDADGRVAETKYKVVAEYLGVDVEEVAREVANTGIKNIRKRMTNAYQGFSLVQCWPKTGRTHQIRVHMNHLRHPIVADETYLGKKRSTLDVLWCPRLFLHATELSFHHPRTGEAVTFTVGVPQDLQGATRYLVEV